jgi:hypothetical protein
MVRMRTAYDILVGNPEAKSFWDTLAQMEEYYKNIN